MQERNRKMIDAIIAKANRDFPGALALIGIYGSFQTGDVHEKSDLDLLILINDERGYRLARTFIQEDTAIGHDLYCTTWEMLEQDAAFSHPHISKLMDSEIVYCADEKHLARLEQLRRQAMDVDTRKAAEQAFREAEHYFALAMLTNTLPELRVYAGSMMQSVMDSIALLNKRYFQLGTRCVFDEIDTMAHKPQNLRAMVDAVVCAGNEKDMKSALSALMQAVEALFETPMPCPQVLSGTFEEMFSNWRNKMYLATETDDRYLAFNSMCCLNAMLKELGFSYDVLGKFDPDDLMAAAKAYDAILENYRKEYDRAGISVLTYTNVDTFVEDYLKKETAL